MKVLEILNEVAYQCSKKMKHNILEGHKDNVTLKRVLYLTYSPLITFYIKKIKPYTREDVDDDAWIYIDLSTALDDIQKIADRDVTGAGAMELLINILKSLKKDDSVVVERIIARDLRCGFGANTINNVFPFLIEKTPYMGCVSYKEKKVRNLFSAGGCVCSEVKYDGRYVNIIVRNSTVEMVSRQGKPSYIPSQTLIDECLLLSGNETFDGQGVVFNGELLMDNVSRYESNGIIASVIKIHENSLVGKNVTKDKVKLQEKHNITFDEAVSNIYMAIWDFIPYEFYVKADTWEVPRVLRLDTLERNMNTYNLTKLRLTEYKLVHSYEDAMTHFSDMVARGEEGTVLKPMNSYWRDGKKEQFKVKLELTVDMVVKGFNEGNGKYVGMLGSLITESSDGLVHADPYAFTDDQRKAIWDNRGEYLDSIVEVKCNGLSHDRDMNYSLLHPVFKMFRDDTTADTLQDIKDNQNMIMGLK